MHNRSHGLIMMLVMIPLLAGCGLFGGADEEEPATPTAVAGATETGVAEPTSTPAPTPEPTPSETIHTVQPGDTLYSISRQYDVPVDAIIQANNIENPDVIEVGQEFVIPQDGGDGADGAEPGATD